MMIILQELKPKTEPPSDPAHIITSQLEPSCGDPETDKKIKNVKKVKDQSVIYQTLLSKATSNKCI